MKRIFKRRVKYVNSEMYILVAYMLEITLQAAVFP